MYSPVGGACFKNGRIFFVLVFVLFRHRVHLNTFTCLDLGEGGGLHNNNDWSRIVR